MSESKAKAIAKTPESEPHAVVSSSPEPKSRFGRLRGRGRTIAKIVSVFIVIMIVVGAVLGYQASHRPMTLPVGTDKDYNTTEQSNVATLLQQQYGINPNKVSDKELDQKLTSFTVAHNVGLALFRLDKNKPALHAYQIGDTKAGSSNQVGTDFYIEMMRVAYASHQKQIGDSAYKKAIAIVNSAGGEDYEKQGQLNSVNDVHDYLLKEYGS